MARSTFYEFFAGGGMARAGIGSDWECLFADDFDTKKAATYRANWGAAELRQSDIATLVASDLPGVADLAWASFPCQDLSVAGSGAGLRGSRSGTFWEFWRLMKDLASEGRKPRSIVLENVCGLLTSHDGMDFKVLMETVAEAGYWIGAIVADAAAFLPQSRPRLFVIAIADSVAGRVQLPYAVDVWHTERLRKSQASLNEQARAQWLWYAPPTPPIHKIRLANVIESKPQDVRWHCAEETGRILAMMSPANLAKVNLVAANQRHAVGAIYKRTRYERGRKFQRAEVRFDMAGCLRTPAGGSSRQIIIEVANRNIRTRLISSRETARLMGLPEEYILPERYNDAYHVTGDGVAVPVVRHVVSTIIEPCLELAKCSDVAA